MLHNKHLLWCTLVCASQLANGMALPKPEIPNSDTIILRVTEEIHTPKGFGDGMPLRIMPLGASITFGYGSTDGNGYRGDLRELLETDGNEVDMVGNDPNGTMLDNESEGWKGYTVNQVRAKASKAVPKYKPNLILINVGTNDCIQDLDIPNAGNRMTAMLNELYDESPQATIILSTLIVNAHPNVQDRVEDFNSQMKRVATKFQLVRRPIILADMQGEGGPVVNDLIHDGIHPNDVGYKKMAQIWFNGIKEADRRAYLKPAEKITGPEDGVA